MFNLLRKLFRCNEVGRTLKLSVIVPTFNSEQYVDRCLESILNQTYSNFELIVVDDHSTDSTLSVLEMYKRKDYRVKVFEKEQNMGSGHSRNLGISLAEGDVVTFIDSDDYLNDLKFFDDCLAIFKENKTDCLITPYLREKNGAITKDLIHCGRKISPDSAVNLYLARKFRTHASCGKFFNKSLLQHSKYVEIGYSQDVMFMAESLSNSKNVCAVNRAGYVYFNDNFSATRPKQITDEHVFSSLRLLVEVLVFQKMRSKKGKKTDLERFIKFWNEDHGARLAKFLHQNHNKSTNIRLLGNTLYPAKSILSQYIENAEIIDSIITKSEMEIPVTSDFFKRGILYLQHKVRTLLSYSKDTSD